MTIDIHKKPYALVAVCLFFVLGCGHGRSTDFEPQFERIHQLEEQGLLTNAVNACSNLLQQQWDSKERGTLLIERGNLRLKLKSFAEAEPDVEEAILLLPPNPDWYKIQGNILAGLGRYQEALASFTKALQLKPNDAVLLSNRAYLHLQFGFAMAAINDCSTAIDLNPNLVSAHSVRAKAYIQQADYAAGAQDLKKLIEIAKPDANSCMDYAKCLYCLGRTNEALGFMAKAAELTVADAGLQKCLMADFVAKLGDIKDALIYLDQAIGLDPTNGVYLQAHGALRMLTNDLEGAGAEIEQGIKLWPHGPTPVAAVIHEEGAYQNRGLLHLFQGNYELAKLDFDKAIQFSPDGADGYTLSALAAALKGDRASALQITQRGMARCSDRAELACLHMLCGGSLSKDMSEKLLQYSPELWPYPLAQYYLGRMSTEDVITHARRPAFDEGGGDICEAYFYIGAKLLVDHQPEKAREYFVKAADYGSLYWPFRQLARKQLQENCLAPLVQGSKSNGS